MRRIHRQSLDRQIPYRSGIDSDQTKGIVIRLIFGGYTGQFMISSVKRTVKLFPRGELFFGKVNVIEYLVISRFGELRRLYGRIHRGRDLIPVRDTVDKVCGGKILAADAAKSENCGGIAG